MQPPADEQRMFSVLGLVMGICGYVSVLYIEAMGQLYWTELVLPLVAVAVAGSRWPEELLQNLRFKVLTTFLLLMLVGYIVSDMAAGATPENYLRGWSRVVFLATDVLALTVIYHRNRWSLWWFWLGTAFYGLQVAVMTGIPLTQWKFGYAEPVTTFAMNGTVFLTGWISAALYLLMGALSIALDYRSFGAIFLIAGAILLVTRSAKMSSFIESIRLRSVLLAAGGVAAAIVAAFMLLANSEGEFAQRRGASDIGRFAGLKIGAIAILDSPIVGYGSWGTGTEKYADLYYQETIDDMARIGAENMMSASTGFLPHSQILQAWMEGGILAVLFFVAYGWYLVVALRDLAFPRSPTRFRGFDLVVLLMGLWHLIMSPFAGNHRLTIAYAVALVICGPMAARSVRVGTADLRPRATSAPLNLMR